MPRIGLVLRCVALSSTSKQRNHPPTALVTGASRGIGRSIALRLADLGYNLFLLARNEIALEDVAGEIQARGCSADYLAGELTAEGYVGKALAAAVAAFGRVNVLVNNAGGAKQQAVQEADLADWSHLMDLNFNSIVALCRGVLPSMVEARQGTVINISSISGRSTNAGSGIYCATKHALNGFTECMYEDVRDYGIKVSTIMPGFVSTDLTSGLGMDSRRMISPEDVADTVAYVLQASPSVCPTEIVLRPQFRP